MLAYGQAKEVSMIINCVVGDIYATKAKHIVFAVSTKGYSDTESPDQIARLWPELANSSSLQLGEIFSQQHEVLDLLRADLLAGPVDQVLAEDRTSCYDA